MALMDRMRKQTCVYWSSAASESGGIAHDDYGQPVTAVASPVEISCRWEDRAEEYIDTNGTKQLSSAVVYVGIDVTVGGVLMNGLLTDITNASSPKENEGAWEIKRVEKMPDRRAKRFLQTVYL